MLLGIPGVDHGFGSRHAGSWPGTYTRVNQVHSNLVVDATDDSQCRADGIVTGDRNRWIGIRTADCVPILIADRRGVAVAAVHAGWRGTEAEISIRAVGRLVQQYGVTVDDLVVAIGPCIGVCCFEVGPEVEQLFQWLPHSARRSRYVDLGEANRTQLQAAGVPAANIDVCGLCTRCDEGEFHSWRRDRDLSGRMVAAISIAGT